MPNKEEMPCYDYHNMDSSNTNVLAQLVTDNVNRATLTGHQHTQHIIGIVRPCNLTVSLQPELNRVLVCVSTPENSSFHEETPLQIGVWSGAIFNAVYMALTVSGITSK